MQGNYTCDEAELLRYQAEKEDTADMCKALEDFERNAAEKGAWEKVLSQVAIKLRKGKSLMSRKNLSRS